MRTVFPANDIFVRCFSRERRLRRTATCAGRASGTTLACRIHTLCRSPGTSPAPDPGRANALMNIEATWYLIIGGLLIAMALALNVIAHLPMTGAMIYLAVGFVLDPAGTG